jgi:hypothetical protein
VPKWHDLLELVPKWHFQKGIAMKNRSKEVYIVKSKPMPAWLEIAGNVVFFGTIIAAGFALIRML